MKTIPMRERLIFALDVANAKEASVWLSRLKSTIDIFKVGLGLAVRPKDFAYVLHLLSAEGKKLFLDLKLFDVPETVKTAVKNIVTLQETWFHNNIEFLTVHGNDAILRAALQGRGKETFPKILAVTALTSLDQADLHDLGFQVDVRTLVLSRAKRALEIGCNGVISSGLEVPLLREELGDKLTVVVPGIRPVLNDERRDDQKRTVDVEDAFQNGADYIVVGRPIRNADNPLIAAENIQSRIDLHFKKQTVTS